MTKGRLVALVAALSLVAAALFGWQALVRQAGGGTPPPAPHPATPPVQITFWHAMVDESAHGKVLNQLVQEFNATHKEIQVVAMYQGSYADLQKKVQAAVGAGNPPAVIQATDMMVGDLARGGQLRPLEGLIPKADLADFPPNMLEQVAYAGQHYALPLNRSVLVLFYNKRLVPVAPRTWDEFRSVAEDVTDDGVAGTALSPDVYSFAPFFLGAGGQWLDDGRVAVADEAGVDALSTMQEMVDDGAAVVLKRYEYASDSFNQGKVAMILDTTASTAYIKPVNGDPWGIAALPAGPDGVRTVGSGGNLAILAAARPAEAQAAATFVNWLTNREGTLKFAMSNTGYGPVRLSAMRDPQWTNYTKVHPEAAVMAAGLTQAVPGPNLRGWDRAQTAITQAVQEALTGGRPADEALATAAASAQAFISQQ